MAIVRPGLEGGGLTVSGGPDFGTVLIKQAGGVNAFADLTAKRNVKISVEEFIKRDPDYVLISGCCDASLTPRGIAAGRAKDPGESGVRESQGGARNKHVIPWLFANHSAGVRGAYTTENWSPHPPP